MKNDKLIFFVLVLVGVYFFWKNRPLAKFPITAIQNLKVVGADRELASISDNCIGKEKCIVMYLAPWCHYSQILRNQLPEFRSRLLKTKKAGLMVIVGTGKTDLENEAFAQTTGGVAFVDNDKTFHTKLKPVSYPDYFVVDKNLKLMARDSSGRSLVNEILNEEP